MSTTTSHHATLVARSSEWRELTLGADDVPKMRLYGHAYPGGGAALVVHFHGGAFVSGSLDSGITVARLLVAAGAVVASVDYPLAGEHPFPAAVEAGYAALTAVYRMRSKLAGPRAHLFVAGEEAGGNLAAALALVARDRQELPLAGQILLGPMLDSCLGTASLRHSEAGPAGCKWADGWCRYLRPPIVAEHPYATPGRALRLAGLPPSLLLSAADDPMRDETRSYAQRLRAAGVAVSECELEAPTGWPAALAKVESATAAWGEAVRASVHAFLATARSWETGGRNPAGVSDQGSKPTNKGA